MNIILYSVYITATGPIWSVNDQTQTTTNNESNLISYRYFHIKKILIIGWHFIIPADLCQLKYLETAENKSPAPGKGLRRNECYKFCAEFLFVSKARLRDHIEICALSRNEEYG